MKRKISESTRQILSVSFQILLFLFLVVLLLQQFFPAEVNSRININWFMLVVIVIGALSIIFSPREETHPGKATRKDYLLVILLGLIGGILIFLKLKEIGRMGYVISVLGGLIIILLSWIILNEKES